MFLKNITIILVLIVSIVDAARILGYFPTPSISHQVIYRALTHELVKRGHEVTIITPDPVYPKGKGPANLIEIDVRDISYADWTKLFVNHIGHGGDLIEQIKKIFLKFASVADLQLQTKQVQEILKKDRKYFDLLLLESYTRTAIGVARVFDAPIIQISSFGLAPTLYNEMGAPIQPILFPTPGRQRLYNLSLLERGIEYFKHFVFDYMIGITEEYDYAVVKKHFGEDSPPLLELRKKIQMMFINEHPLWVDNRPVSPNILYIGGIHQPAIEELPAGLKEFLDSSKHGVIYASFGTNVDTTLVPEEKINVITKVFSELPYDILWKWDGDELPGKPKNVKTSKWFPQPSLLNLTVEMRGGPKKMALQMEIDNNRLETRKY